MIVEHEIIEQIEEEPVGRTFAWCLAFAGEQGCSDPMTTLREMWRDGYVVLADADGAVLPDWRAREVWRAGVPREDLALLATDLGSAWVHG